MSAWRFEGVLLPTGDHGQVVVGVGDPEPLPGTFALTGLVDAHCHFTVDVDARGLPFVSDAAFAERRLGELAREGVTLLRDVGGASEVTLDYARSPRPGLPLVIAAGRFHSTRERYFPPMYAPVDAEQLDESIRAEIAAGATWVKIITDFPHVVDGVPQPASVARTYDDAVLARAVSTAHEAGARVAAHSTLSPSALVAMGVDSIEHGNGLDEDDLTRLGARGGAWTPTLGAALAVPADASPAMRARKAELSEHYRHHLSFALRSGVTVMAGSDAVTTVGADVGLMVQHGLTARQAIDAATVAARLYLGVEPGADLVTYALDPRSDPEVLASPSAVVLRGERVV
jgi:imidazolonepropionase-like amidohydrolase